jgi:ubiquinone/menaquinone biosynthesis C-methylase UbiE
MKMQAALQRRIQRYGWDKAAADYESYWSRQIAPAQEKLLAMAALEPGDFVLDVACGTGLVTFTAASQVGRAGSLVGTDISEEMVNRCRAAASARHIGNVAFLRVDAEQLRFQDNVFDAALCSLGLMYVPDPAQAVAEMCRVLGPGGRAVAAVWGDRRHCGWAGIFPIVDARVKSDVCPMFFQLGTGDNFATAFSTAGFDGIHAERLETRLRYSSPEEACGAAFAGGPVAMAYSRFDEPTRAAAHAEYIESIAVYRNGSGYDIPGEFVIVSARKPD